MANSSSQATSTKGAVRAATPQVLNTLAVAERCHHRHGAAQYDIGPQQRPGGQERPQRQAHQVGVIAIQAGGELSLVEA